MRKIPRHELTRKLIHLACLTYPAFYVACEVKEIMLICVSLILLAVLLFDFLRMKNEIINRFFCKYFGFALRGHEHKNFAGSTHFMIGTFLTVLCFSKSVAIVALCVLVISDTCASIIGLKYGKKTIVQGKSVEGSVAFLLSALGISFMQSFSMHLPILPLVMASLVATILEMFNKKLKIDDNILVPVGYGFTCFLYGL